MVLWALRQFGLAETELSQAQGDTLRVKLRKIGVVVRVTVRKVWVALSEAYPYRVLVVGVAERLARLSVPRSPAVVGSG